MPFVGLEVEQLEADEFAHGGGVARVNSSVKACWNNRKSLETPIWPKLKRACVEPGDLECRC